MRKLKKGDYVLATKWSDGDPKDPWCVGFYQETINRGNENFRHLVTDKDGNSFYLNGFRRAKRISSERGTWIVQRATEIEKFYPCSLWHLYKSNLSSINI